MGQSTRGIGKMICSMEMGWKHGLMDRGIRGIIKRGRNMGRGCMFGVMDLNMKESGLIIKLMEKEYIHG
jgi:hypothetical protein